MLIEGTMGKLAHLRDHWHSLRERWSRFRQASSDGTSGTTTQSTQPVSEVSSRPVGQSDGHLPCILDLPKELEGPTRLSKLLSPLYREGNLNPVLNMEVYSLVYRSVVVTTSWTSTPWALQVLELVIRHEFTLIAKEFQLPPLVEETEFLSSVHQKLGNIDDIARKVNNFFRYMNRVFLSRVRDEGYQDLPSTIYDFHMTKYQEVALPIIRTKVQRRGIRHIINGGSLNTLLVSAFESRDGRPTLQAPEGLRPVYLVLEKLASKNIESSNIIGQLSPALRLLPDYLLDLTSRMATIDHWGLVVIDCPMQINTHELHTLSSRTSPASENPDLPVLRCELVREGSGTSVSTTYHTFTEALAYRLIPIGCTFFSNKAIEEEAGKAIGEMPRGYHASRNNCQTLCAKLFSRIRVPTMREELLAGFNEYQRPRDDNTKKRWADFVRFKILEAVAQTPRSLPSFRQLPLDVESALDATHVILIFLILFFAWKQLGSFLFALLALALFLGYLHGNHRTPCVLTTSHDVAELQEEELVEAMETIISEMSPLSDALTASIMETYKRA